MQGSTIFIRKADGDAEVFQVSRVSFHKSSWTIGLELAAAVKVDGGCFGIFCQANFCIAEVGSAVFCAVQL